MGKIVERRQHLNKTTGEIFPGEGAVTFTISLAASSTTDGMDITVQAVNGNGAEVNAVTPVELWISEAATGLGLTADSTGTLTAATGVMLTEFTDDKHARFLTDATGTLVALLVDSNNPADQYVAVAKPDMRGIVVSAASGTNWEGA